MPKLRRSLGKFFRYFGISFLQSEWTTAMLYPVEFKQRVKNEYRDPTLWEALDNTDHVFVGNYLKINCRKEYLNASWVVEMHKQKRYCEVRELAECMLNRLARRRALYVEWHQMVKGEFQGSTYQQFAQGVPGEIFKEKFW
jgi:hypothetical protein